MTDGGPRNLVLCCDGTGQAASTAQGTNVWRLRAAVAQEERPLPRQVVYYEPGLGSGALNLSSVLGKAFGYGLSADIRQLYTSLARTYRPGDVIYLFGFSRGAFAVRALAGMISEVGVIGGRLRSGHMEMLVHRAYRAYRSRRGDAVRSFKNRCKRDAVQIREARVHFLGLWDTVAAYGLPLFEPFMRRLRRPLNVELTDRIDNVYHALALDDNRSTFLPFLYDEAAAGETNVEQTWFVGAHSDVGGGYPTQGLSALTLNWMICKAESHGLRIDPEAAKEVQRLMDVTGVLHDQRRGLGASWAYGPRNVGWLCRDSHTRPRVHVSVMKRMSSETTYYGPITLPVDFEVVGAEMCDQEELDDLNRSVQGSRQMRDQAVTPAWRRINGYRLMSRLTRGLAVLYFFFALRFMVRPDATIEWYRSWSLIHRFGITWQEFWLSVGGASPAWIGVTWRGIKETYLALTPDAFSNLLAALWRLPEVVMGLVTVLYVFNSLKSDLLRSMRHQGLDMWGEILSADDGEAGAPEP